MTNGVELLNRLLSSEAKGDLLVLFHTNPGLIDTVDGVGRRIGRTGDAIAKDTDDLVDLGVLRKNKIGNSEVLLLDGEGDREVQDSIVGYLRGLERESAPKEIMAKAINDTLVDLLGLSAANIIARRVDPKIAPYDPLGYEVELMGLLGPMSESVIRRMRDNICEISGKRPAAWCKGLEGCLKCIEQGVVSDR